jgi:hypothetical protein
MWELKYMKAKIPKGWRKLRVGEYLKKTDKLHFSDGLKPEWDTTGFEDGTLLTRQIAKVNGVYIRKELVMIKNQANGTEARVCADIASRQQFGIKKYGQTVEQNPLPLREWLEHAYYEALDHAVYLKRAMEEIDKKK